MSDKTQHNKFVINTNKLYIHKDYKEKERVNGHTITNQTNRFEVDGVRVTYYFVESQHKYFKDCLETAEDLINDDYPSKIQDVVRSKVKHLNQNFGERDDQNIELARQYRKQFSEHANQKADPDVGEAYVMVSLEQTTTYPYHAGAVIATDGDSRVTLEVFADRTDAKKRTEVGTYQIYSKNEKETFHQIWENNVKGDPVTIVIKPK